LNEVKLITACQNGDKQAFNELITLYYPYVSKFLIKLTKDETITEDIVQETFLKLIRSIENFDIHGKAAFSTYLVTIARNCYIDQIRKDKHVILNIDGQEIADKWSLEDKVLKDIEITEAFQLLETLPQEQAEVIRLKYLEQMTLAEIAEKLDTQPKTIKSRIHEGMKKIRKGLIGGGKHYE